MIESRVIKIQYFTDFLHNSDFADSNFKNAESVFIGYGIEFEKYNELEKIDETKHSMGSIGRTKMRISEKRRRKLKKLKTKLLPVHIVPKKAVDNDRRQNDSNNIPKFCGVSKHM